MAKFICLFFYDNVNNYFRVDRVVGDEKHSSAAFKSLVGRTGRDFQFVALPRFECAFSDADAEAGVVHLQSGDHQGRLSGIGEFHLALLALRATVEIEMDGGTIYHGRWSRRQLFVGVFLFWQQRGGDI